ncbi:MAG: lysoplasmalogenase family protein [Candidatus Odinarchaeota archaeon]
MALLLRFLIIETDKFSQFIKNSDITEISGELNPKRFLNLMPIAMILCTIADLLIYFNFILGALTFLFAQIVYIIAYSGIIHLHPKNLFNKKNIRKNSTVIIIWIIIIIILYLSFIYNPSNSLTLLVLPYIIFIGIMVIITYLGGFYTKRLIKFRILLILGSTFFLISDTILGYNRFKMNFDLAGLLIGLTYLLGVFFLQIVVMVVDTSAN